MSGGPYDIYVTYNPVYGTATSYQALSLSVEPTCEEMQIDDIGITSVELIHLSSTS